MENEESKTKKKEKNEKKIDKMRKHSIRKDVLATLKTYVFIINKSPHSTSREQQRR